MNSPCLFPLTLFANIYCLKLAGTADKVNPKDIAKLGGTSLILGCHLKAMDRLGQGISSAGVTH